MELEVTTPSEFLHGIIGDLNGRRANITEIETTVTVTPAQSNDEQIKELLRYYEDPGSYGGQDRGRLYSRGSSKSPEVGTAEAGSRLRAESRANASHGSQGLSTSNSASSLLGQSRTSPSSSVRKSSNLFYNAFIAMQLEILSM